MKHAPLRYVLIFGLGAAAALSVQRAWGGFGQCDREYDLLSSARRCADVMPQGEWNYEPLRERLSAKKEELKASGAVTHLSIYFQDLDHGPRFGIGEYDKFQPASLMKVPLLIFFLHAADLKPDILEKPVSYSGDLDVRDNVLTMTETIEPDKEYPVRELLRKMIVYSDNRSYALLLKTLHAVSEPIAYKTFLDLDVLQMMLESDETFISISSYAKLYAVLYSTGYLSKDMSQFALELLSETTFEEGIVAGVPEGTRVAHKFGYASIDGEGQLHDCGIVYHPKMAYILCVMTSTKDENKANDAMIEISRIVHDAVSSLDFTHP